MSLFCKAKALNKRLSASELFAATHSKVDETAGEYGAMSTHRAFM